MRRKRRNGATAQPAHCRRIAGAEGNSETVFKTVAFVRSATLPAGP